MSASVERKATSFGVISALILLTLVVAAGLVFGDPPEQPTSGMPIASDDELLPGGTRMTLTEASEVFPVPLFRPDTPLASDATVSETWVRVNNAPEVWIQYRSGIVVLVRPIGDLPPVGEFAEAQIAEGIPGRLVTVEGIDAFLVPQNENGSGSVQFVLDGTLVTIIGWIGDFSVEQLTDAAGSAIKTSTQLSK